MGGCCDPRGCDRMFDQRFAAHRARTYRQHGLDRPQERMVDFLASVGIEGRSVLEIGGGVGEIPIDLLRRGASTATNVEIVRAYDEEARQLAREMGVADRISQVVGDVAVDPDLVAPADLVVLHRVVCCYPDVKRLLGAAAHLTGHALVLSHPPYNLLARGLIQIINLVERIRRMEYRSFDHDPDLMTEVLREGGLSVVHRRSGLVWQVVGAVRT
ncbi:MAG: SAM-dependent methyltransferase [Actinomycetales bacterium]|nr:SAM-dependent methyltransferase [Actinomycetales bacterium]